MKRSISFVLSLVLLVSVFLFACQDENRNSGEDKEPHKQMGDVSKKEDSIPEKEAEKTKTTREFYELINRSETFWFKMEIVSGDDRYYFTQATDGKSIASVIDYNTKSDYRYEITEFKDGLAYVHTLNFIDKKYDTLVTETYQSFLFGDEDPKAFSKPSQKGDIQKKEKTFYCEKFETASSDGGAVDGFNAYYFEDGRLALVEVNEKGVLTMTMRVLDYGTEIPDDICLTPPADFAKGNIEIDTTIDFGSLDWFE